MPQYRNIWDALKKALDNGTSAARQQVQITMGTSAQPFTTTYPPAQVGTEATVQIKAMHLNSSVEWGNFHLSVSLDARIYAQIGESPHSLPLHCPHVITYPVKTCPPRLVAEHVELSVLTTF